MSAYGDSVRMHESLLAMMLFPRASVYDSQPIPILSSASGRDDVDNQKSNKFIIIAIKYENIASLFRQCDACANKSIKSSNSVNNTMYASFAGVSSRIITSGSHGKGLGTQINLPCSTPDELRSYKEKFFCSSCGLLDHCSSAHRTDGT